MAFTAREGLIVLHSWGRFKTKMRGSGVDCGDLVKWRTDGGDEGVEICNGDGFASAVAVEARREDEDVWCAFGAELMAPDVIATAGGAVTPYYWDTDTATSNGLRADPLYTATGGKLTGSESTAKQIVGHITAANRVVVTPKGYLTATAVHITPAEGAGYELTVTGVSTMASWSCPTGTDITLTKGNVTLTEGDMALTKGDLTITEKDILSTLGDVTLTAGNLNCKLGDVTLTKGNITLTDGHVSHVRITDVSTTSTLTTAQQHYINCDTTGGDRIVTLPTAAAGLWYHITHYFGANRLNINANTSDEIIDPTDGGHSNYIYDDKGVDNAATVLAIDGVHWVVTYASGTSWTGA